ncbi:tail fibers protein [Pseudoalteromonas phage H103]|uniref:tail protein n=1 Tax=Pseudoalteromonas phage H103 TaxID=1636200 RepID=UPI0006BD6A11|nr:tail protein [Pseudoalteromonas phage H103]AKA61186.1 tail fibers protein [Pseudoalteromonas phage H103]
MSNIANTEANATSLDGLVNDNGLITTLRNGPKPSWQYIVDQVYAQLGYAVAGSFVDGFTYTGIRQVGADASGNTWIYTGGEQNLPHVVPAGTVPSAPDYFQVSVNSADNVVLDNGENLQQAIDRLNGEIDSLQEYIDGQQFASVDAVKSYPTLSALIGYSVKTKEYHSGTGYGEATYDVVSAGSVTPNDVNVIQGVADSSAAIVLRDTDSVYAYGVLKNSNSDQLERLQVYADNCHNFNLPSDCAVKISDGLSIPHGRVSIFGRVDPVDGATFTTSELVKIGSYEGVQVGTVTNALEVGFATVFTESTASLSVGDIVTIYNPADFSWSNHRFYYKQGEHLKVSEVIDGTSFKGGNNIFDDYAAGTPLYKLNSKKCSIEALNVHAGDTASYAVTIESLSDGEVNSLTCTGGTIATIHRNRCYNLKFNNPSSLQSYNDGSATNYAHYTLSCQNVVDINPNVRALRHAIALTARNQELSIPNRGCGAIGGVATTFGSAPGVTALDFHGCTEACFYLDMEVNGGVNIGGKNNKVRAKIYQRSHSSCIYGGELVNTNHDYSDCTIITSQAGAQSRGQWIDIGGNAGSLDADVKSGGTLNFRGLVVECLGNPTTSADTIKITNRGYVGDDIKLNFDGMQYVGDSSFDNWVRFLIGRVETGSYINEISIKNAKVNNMALELTANNIYCDGYSSIGAKNLNNKYPAVKLLPVTGIADVGDITVYGASYSGLEVNGALGGDVAVFISSTITCIDCNNTLGSTTEEKSGVAIRQVETAVTPSVIVKGLNVASGANNAIRVNTIDNVVRGEWSFTGYSNTEWSGASIGYDDMSIGLFSLADSAVFSATSLGSVTGRFAVYNQDGVVVGEVPIYDSIT